LDFNAIFIYGYKWVNNGLVGLKMVDKGLEGFGVRLETIIKI